MVIIGDRDSEIKDFSEIEEIRGKLSLNNVDEKLMHSVLENDRETIDKGKIIKEAVNYGISSFNPDLMFEQLVNNYSMAKQLFGESLISLLSGFDSDYVKKNINVPEFRKELMTHIKNSMEELKDKEIIDDNGLINEKGIELSSLILYIEELDNIISKGIFGEKFSKSPFIYGEKQDIAIYKKSRYRDIAIKKSAKTAIRRGHSVFDVKDLRVFKRKSKGNISIIYGLDASGSMKGEKIDKCKKAGIALAYRAISEKDKVGLIVFGSEIKKKIMPTNDFSILLKGIAEIRASKETNIPLMIKDSVEMFPKENVTKHLIILSDALPTVGEEPEKDSLEAASLARSNGITISLVGINLDKKGINLGKRMVEIGGGRFYIAEKLEDVDKIVLSDYARLT